MDLTAVWTELETLVMDTWTDCAKGYLTTGASRMNWRDALDSGKIDAPFAVLRELELEPNDDFGLARHHYNLGFEIYYVRSATRTSGEITAGTRVEDAIKAKLVALFNALHDGTFDTFQMIDEPRLDASDRNEANQSFFSTGAPYLAGVVTGSVLVWDETMPLPPGD